jgi:hypothetical protein
MPRPGIVPGHNIRTFLKIYIRHLAVRDRNANYSGTFEVTQNATHLAETGWHAPPHAYVLGLSFGSAIPGRPGLDLQVPG